MEILIVGEVYSPNLGDPIIVQSLTTLVKNIIKKPVNITYLDLSARHSYLHNKIYPNANYEIIKKIIFYVISFFPFLYEKNKIVFNIRKEYFKNKMNSDYDLIIFAGGQMFRDCFAIPINYIVKEANKKKIPVVFNACGFAEMRSKKLQNLLYQTLRNNNIKYISTRDDKNSISKLLGSQSIPVIKTYDPAIFASDIYDIKKKKSNIIGLGVMNYSNFSETQLIDFWKRITDYLIINNIQFIFFTNGNISDQKLARKIAAIISEKNSITRNLICERPKEPHELVEIISQFSGIISFRLHSLIVSYSLNIKSVAINWDNKVKFFYDSINRPNHCFEINDNASQIVETLISDENLDTKKILTKHKKFVFQELNNALKLISNNY